MDTPVQIRGRFYNTLRVYRCPNFHQCITCKKCQNYNPHLIACQNCEVNKPTICKHTDEQQVSFLKVQDLFNKPFSHVDDVATDGSEVLRRHQEEKELIELEKNLADLKIEAKDT